MPNLPIDKRMLKGVRVVSLDAMDTVIALREAPGAVYARIASECGLEANPSEVDARFPKVFRELERRKPCYDFAGEGARSWWDQAVAETLGFAASSRDPRLQSAQRRLFDFYASAEPWRLVDDHVVEHLGGLRARGLGVVFASNFDFRLRRILQELRIPAEELFLSGEIGLQKPDPRFFEHVLHVLRLGPDALLHVGDHPQKDVDAPQQLGIRALLLHSPSFRSLGDLLSDDPK
uniref:HAD family hydrolase n=1 Tax=Steinernema glaseri TaxID=37863 RepID=A0A1I7YPP5_9BILA